MLLRVVFPTLLVEAYPGYYSIVRFYRAIGVCILFTSEELAATKLDGSFVRLLDVLAIIADMFLVFMDFSLAS